MSKNTVNQTDAKKTKSKITMINQSFMSQQKADKFNNTQMLDRSVDFCSIRESLRSARATSKEASANSKIMKVSNKKNPYFEGVNNRINKSGSVRKTLAAEAQPAKTKFCTLSLDDVSLDLTQINNGEEEEEEVELPASLDVLPSPAHKSLMIEIQPTESAKYSTVQKAE